MPSALAMLDVLVVDGQSTGASPAHDHLLELGWARTCAGTLDDALAGDARLLALPEGATIPRPVARLTGIGLRDLLGAHAPAQAWAALREAASPGGVALPVVIHYARFEAAFLHALHAAQAPGEPFPLALLCTHEIARRLLPGLPRRGLRALAGYLGHGVDELKRTTEHVRATAFVWRELVVRLQAEHGVTTLAELEAWLGRPPPRREARRAYPMPRDKRLAVPDEPGVYRMLRTSGEVLYVGKATSLRQRVNGYFRQHRHVADRTLEMLTQARDLHVTPTVTALEAALLENDEIKAHAPPYNVMLRGAEHGPWYATTELAGWCERCDARHRVGPLRTRTLLDAWAQLARSTAGDAPPAGLERLAWWGGRAPEAAVWRAGWERFASTWLPGCREPSRAALARAGAQLWQAWRRAQAVPPEDEPAEPEVTAAVEATAELAWDPVRVAEVIERVVGQGAHELRRARWLCRLSECVVSWARRDGTSRRVLVLERGAVVQRHDAEPTASAPVPPGWARTPAERRAAFDMASFDRLRVLTAQLRRIAAEGRTVELCLGPRQRLTGERLDRALAWV
jgi:DNA polymerase III subunit epsilon